MAWYDIWGYWFYNFQNKSIDSFKSGRLCLKKAGWLLEIKKTRSYEEPGFIYN
jgi:hypothetical protein